MQSKNLKFTMKTVLEKKVRKDKSKEKEECRKGWNKPRTNCYRNRNNCNPSDKDNEQLDNNGGSARCMEGSGCYTNIKKRDAKKMENYRPMSCLIVALKVMERVVCDQVQKNFQVHRLLTNHQHGF